MAYKDTFPNRVSIVLDNIEADDNDVTVPSSIEFAPRDNPDISVDTAGRFAKHSIIGGDVVRQKVGEDAINITIDGICDEETARDIDRLRNARAATLISDRITIMVQIGSTSTQPTESGGAVDMDTGDYLYNYTLNCIGVGDPQ